MLTTTYSRNDVITTQRQIEWRDEKSYDFIQMKSDWLEAVWPDLAKFRLFGNILKRIDQFYGELHLN